MNYDNILRADEKYALYLRNLYQKAGYSQYKMSKFEEYDLYLANKNFLQNETVITFTSPRGQLMALKPDITLSIVKNFAESGESAKKVHYNENVYRATSEGDLQEQIQIGVENIGDITVSETAKMLSLASESLSAVSEDFIISISHLKVVTDLLSEMNLSDDIKASITRRLAHKNAHEIISICEHNGVSEDLINKLITLVKIYGSFEETLPIIKEISGSDAVSELEKVYKQLKSENLHNSFRLDFSIMSDLDYYNGIIFQGYVSGVPTAVLSGGRYDNLIRKFNKKEDAIGFAIYLDKLQRCFNDDEEKI